MSKLRFILFLAMTMMVAGCLRTSGLKYAPPALEDGWSVKMTLEGGVAGLKRSIQVGSDGTFIVVDERTGDKTAGELTEEELAGLEELISTLDVSTSNESSACADCFEYEIEIDSGGRKMIVNADDLTLGDSGAGALVQFLREKMDTALK